jgi:hypothetical protein
MSACARCRWGPGTTTERPPNTENAKQLEGGFAAIMAARQAQDTHYFPQANHTTNIYEISNKNSNTIRNASKQS